MIGRLLGLAIAALALLHGYFYMAFGTFDPCTAATFRLINKEESAAVRGAGLLFSNALDKALRSKGVLTCYRVAITGEQPEGLL